MGEETESSVWPQGTKLIDWKNDTNTMTSKSMLFYINFLATGYSFPFYYKTGMNYTEEVGKPLYFCSIDKDFPLFHFS